MNFHEHPNRGRTFGCTRGRGKSSGNATRKIAQGVPRKSDEALLAAERLRMNDLCETQMRLGELIPQTGITRVKEERGIN